MARPSPRRPFDGFKLVREMIEVFVDGLGAVAEVIQPVDYILTAEAKSGSSVGIRFFFFLGSDSLR